MTGNSTCGNGATGRNRNASSPDSSNATVSSDVPTGRLINGAEIFIYALILPTYGNSHSASATHINIKSIWRCHGRNPKVGNGEKGEDERSLYRITIRRLRLTKRLW